MGYNGNTAREIAGVGSIINTKHEGTLKRPVEAAARDLDDWHPAENIKKTPQDFHDETRAAASSGGSLAGAESEKKTTKIS